jgi:hypothetical protein
MKPSGVPPGKSSKGRAPIGSSTVLHEIQPLERASVWNSDVDVFSHVAAAGVGAVVGVGDGLVVGVCVGDGDVVRVGVAVGVAVGVGRGTANTRISTSAATAATAPPAMIQRRVVVTDRA